MNEGDNAWRPLDAPAEREPLGFEAEFTASEAQLLMRGSFSQRMEDKWHIYFADDWLRFHRSWTGVFIYALRMEGSEVGTRVVESWVNRNPQQYAWDDTEYDRKLVRFLIDARLLKKPSVTFPIPSGFSKAPNGLLQHSVVGRAYPESSSE